MEVAGHMGVNMRSTDRWLQSRKEERRSTAALQKRYTCRVKEVSFHGRRHQMKERSGRWYVKFGRMCPRKKVANAGLSKNATLCTSLGALIRLRISSEAHIRDGWYNDTAVVQVQASQKEKTWTASP